MWICPKCGREFKRTNQDHYCGKAPESVDEYIARQSPEACAHLTELRSLLRRSVPGVTEQIAWSMPRYKKDGHDLSFAACKKHVSFYVDAEILERFRPQLSGYVIRKNALYLPYDLPLPLEVLEEVVNECFHPSASL